LQFNLNSLPFFSVCSANSTITIFYPRFVEWAKLTCPWKEAIKVFPVVQWWDFENFYKIDASVCVSPGWLLCWGLQQGILIKLEDEYDTSGEKDGSGLGV
jgi:hypothetical protein